jgi:hypothetical protein
VAVVVIELMGLLVLLHLVIVMEVYYGVVDECGDGDKCVGIG